jgi:hypothetical protein
VSASRLHPERREHLPEKPLRIRAVGDSDVFYPGVARQVPCPEQKVPDDRRVAEVAQCRARIARVVPAVRLGASDDVIEPAVAQPDIAVLKETVHRVEQEIAGDDLRGDAERDERHGVEAEMQGFFEWMKARDVEHVQDIGRVMDFVQAPQRGITVARAMKPVAHEIDGEDHEHCLCGERPAVGPQGTARMLVHPSSERDRTQGRQSLRQRDLHQRHESAIRLDVAPPRAPLQMLRKAPLEEYDRDADRDDGEVSRKRDGHAAREHDPECRDGPAEKERIPEIRQEPLSHHDLRPGSGGIRPFA